MLVSVSSKYPPVTVVSAVSTLTGSVVLEFAASLTAISIAPATSLAAAFAPTTNIGNSPGLPILLVISPTVLTVAASPAVAKVAPASKAAPPTAAIFLNCIPPLTFYLIFYLRAVFSLPK